MRTLQCLAVLGPLVLATDVLLLLWGEVVRDIECLADLLGGLALDHVCHGLAANIQERLNVKEIGSLDSRLVGSQTFTNKED